MDSINVIKDKCAQYWNEPGICDAEIHAVLEYIYDEANKVLREYNTLHARLDSARKLLDDNGVRFYWRRVRSLAQQHDGDDRQLYLQVPTNLRELLNKFVDDSDTWLAEDGNDAGASVRPADLEE